MCVPAKARILVLEFWIPGLAGKPGMRGVQINVRITQPYPLTQTYPFFRAAYIPTAEWKQLHAFRLLQTFSQSGLLEERSLIYTYTIWKTSRVSPKTTKLKTHEAWVNLDCHGFLVWPPNLKFVPRAVKFLLWQASYFSRNIYMYIIHLHVTGTLF